MENSNSPLKEFPPGYATVMVKGEGKEVSFGFPTTNLNALDCREGIAKMLHSGCKIYIERSPDERFVGGDFKESRDYPIRR